MWNQYEEKYSIKNRHTHSQMVRTQYQQKQEAEQLREYLDQLQVQSAIKRSQREDKPHNGRQTDSLGNTYQEYEPETPAQESHVYRGLVKTKKVEKKEGNVDEEIKAKPLIVNNIKTIISPTSDDIDFGVIRKCKPRKNKKRTESEQSQSTTEETSVSHNENHGLFSEFVQDEPQNAEPEERPFIQFVNMGQPPQRKEEPAPAPEPQPADNASGKYKVIESNGLQIVQKKVK